MTHATAEKWVSAIQACRSTQDVVATVQDYLDTWTPSEIGEIPRTAWPGEVSTPAEISVGAVAAKFEELRYVDDGPSRVSLQELGAVLSAASTRLGLLSSVLAPKSGG